MFVRLSVLAAALYLSWASVSLAQNGIFECKMRTYGQGWYTSDLWFVALDAKDGVGSLFSGNIQDAKGAPITMKYTKRSQNKYRMRFSLEERFSDNSTGKIDYDVTFNLAKPDLVISVAFPGEADNIGMGARGKCKPVE